MGEPTSCCRSAGGYCQRCDLLVGLDGLRVIAVDRDDGGALTVTVESEPSVMGCRACGVVARGHGRLEVHLVDAPAMGRPVRICWRKRRWICLEPACPVTTFVEQDDRVAAPRAKLTTRACRWAIEQIRREHASVNGLRCQLSAPGGARSGSRSVRCSPRPTPTPPGSPPSRFDRRRRRFLTITGSKVPARSRGTAAGHLPCGISEHRLGSGAIADVARSPRRIPGASRGRGARSAPPPERSPGRWR